MKKMSIFILLVVIVNTASAYRIEYGKNIVISQPVMENLYIAGGTVTINAPVYGDVIIAGGTIIINDTITNDILVTGGEITFNGFVGDDIRCAGGNINITANVKGDVLVTGGTLIIRRGAAVGGLIVAGGTITIDGDVNGEVKSTAGDFILNGNVEKNFNSRGNKVTVNGNINGTTVLAANEIVIGSNAAFNNNIRYWNKKGTLNFKQSLKNGTATYDEALRLQTGKWYFLGAATFLGVLWYLGMALLMIFIIQYFFAAVMRKAAETAFNNTLKSLGLGLLFFIGVPLAIIIAFISLIGVPVGLLLFFGYIILLLLAVVITAVISANWYNNRNNYNWTNQRLSFAAFGVFILISLLSSIPFLGWIVTGLLVCICFGSIIKNIKWKSQKRQISL